jgi:hypothetical protein
VPQSIPPGLKKEHVLQALSDLDGGIDHPFGAPTGYELVHGDKRYAPKAVVGLACRYHLGRVLQPDEFSGGEAPGQTNFVLRKLGFTVVRKGEEVAEEENPTHKDWSEQEVALIVSDYFTMLEKELLGKPFSKTEHRRSLVQSSDLRRGDQDVAIAVRLKEKTLGNLGRDRVRAHKDVHPIECLPERSYLDPKQVVRPSQAMHHVLADDSVDPFALRAPGFRTGLAMRDGHLSFQRFCLTFCQVRRIVLGRGAAS